MPSLSVPLDAARYILFEPQSGHFTLVETGHEIILTAILSVTGTGTKDRVKQIAKSQVLSSKSFLAGVNTQELRF